MRRSLVRAPAGRPGRLIAGLALVIAAAPVAIYLWLAAHRIGYRYELNWLEGGTVELVDRVLHGRGLYSPPSLGYVGFTYTPLFSFVSAAVAKLTGIGFLPLRIVSLASSLVAMAILGLYVRAMTHDWVAGAVAAGLFAAMYGLTGFFFDVGRLDSMFMALTLLALWAGRSVTSVRLGAGVGVLAFLAFFTKQVGLIAVAPALVVALPFRPRAAVAALVTLVVLAGASTLILDSATGGWYRYYILSELAGQPDNPTRWLGFWRVDLYGNLRALTLLAVLGAVASIRRRLPGAVAGPLLYDLAGAGGLLAAAWISRVHTGGYLNVLIPAYGACAGIGGWAFASLRARGWLAALAATVLVGLQCWGLVHHPGKARVKGYAVIAALPTHQDQVAGAELIAKLRRLPGPVLVLRHPWYGTEAGKGSFAQSDGIAEVLRSHGPHGAVDLRHALAGSLNRYHIQTVVLDSAPPAWLAPQLEREFRLVSSTFLTPPLRPPTDLPSSPEYLWVRQGG